MSLYAPILIPTLNRFEHFRRCVESLSVSPLAAKTELFIALDYPLRENHWEGYNKILDYLKNIKGFYKVTVIKRETNFGPYKNLYDSIDYVFERYDSIVFSEDDNLFSPKFLKYVNDGLAYGKDKENIFSICGYNSPVKMPHFYREDVYLRRAWSAWGAGLWKDKWYDIDWSMKRFNNCIDDSGFIKKVKNEAPEVLKQLYKMRQSGAVLGDGVVFAHLVDRNMYSVYPVKTKVRNTGHDGTGVHCVGGDQGTEKYLSQQIDISDVQDVFPDYLVPNKELLNNIKVQRQGGNWQIFKNSIPDGLKNPLRNLIKKYK